MSTHDATTIQDMIDTLLTKDAIFAKLFTEVYTMPNLTELEWQTAQHHFTETFPNYGEKDFKLFFQTYIRNQSFADMQLQEDLVTAPSEICNRLAYDASKRNYIKMPKVNTFARGKRDKFNLGEFLRAKRENGDYFQLNVGDREMVEDLMDELNQDKPRNDQKADVALNRMVEMAAVLNGNCNYKIIDLHSERRIQ